MSFLWPLVALVRKELIQALRDRRVLFMLTMVPVIQMTIFGYAANIEFNRAETVVVHLLDANDIDVAKLGASRGVDRFAQAQSWSRLPTGEPVYDGVRAWVRCAVIDRMDAGTSTVIAAHALESGFGRELGAGDAGDALVYHNRAWHRLSDQSRIDA